MRAWLALALWAASVWPTFAAQTDQAYAKPHLLVTLPDGRRINLHCSGQGAPTVLLEAGWSDGALSWRKVQPLVARQTRVCAYDRAGLGFSDATTGPRDTLNIVKDLEALVAAAELPAPYVVVGYSMGGLAARLFADRNLAGMSGLVLVEPSIEHQAERFRAVLPGRRPPRPMQAPAAADLPPEVAASQSRIKAQRSYQQTVLAELVGMQTTGSDQVKASRRNYGELPLVVLTAADNAGEQDFSAQERSVFQLLWRELHRQVARLSSVGESRLIPGTTHQIILERPEVIAEAVSDVTARGRGP